MKLSDLSISELEYLFNLAAKFEVDTSEVAFTSLSLMVGQTWISAIEKAGVEELDFSFDFNGLSSSLVCGGLEVSGWDDLVGMVYTVDIGVNGNDEDCIMVFNSKEEVVFSTSDLDISEDGLKAEMVLAGVAVEGRIVLRY